MGTYQDPEMIKWVIEEDKRLRKAAAAGDKQAQAELKKLPNPRKFLGIGRPEVYTTSKDPGYLEKKYYKEIFAPKQKKMIEDAVTANPSLQITEKKDKKGNVLSYEITNPELKGKPYIIENPAYYPPGKGANQRAASLRTYSVMNQLVNNKPYDPKKVSSETKKYAVPDHGDNNFFGSAGQFIESAMPKITMPKAVSDTGKFLEKGISNISKEAGKGALQTIGAVKQGVADIGREAIVSQGNIVSELGRGSGVEALEKAGEDINRETRKNADTYLGAAFDVAANVATQGQYGALQTLASAASKGDLSAFTDSKQLQDLAISAAASELNINPDMLKSGLALSKGDIREAALSAAGSYGIDPEKLKIAESILSGDKQQLTSSLAGMAGLDENIADVAGSLAGGKNLKSSLISGFSNELGIDKNIANTLGGDMDLKKMALEQLGSLGGIDAKTLESLSKGDLKGSALSGIAEKIGIDPKTLDSISKGKIDPMQLAGAAGFDPKQLLGGAASSLGLSAIAGSPEAQQVMDLGRSAGRAKEEIEKNIQAAQATTQESYKIAKGDSFNAIAKKLGVTPEQLKAANPQIKDINKISAGASLNLPSTIKVPSGARASVTDKYLKDASGKTIYGPNNAPIPNPSYSEAEANKAAAGIASAYETEQSVPQVEEKGFWDGVKDKVSGAFGSAKDFVAENKGLIGTGAQAAAAGLGYKASKEGMEAQQKLIKDQLKQEQAIGSELLGKKYDPNRYEQEQKFLAERIQGQGRTALTRQMEQESIQKAARTAAAARLAGMEQQARLGGGAALGTAGLASALAGAQSGQNVMAEDLRARDVQAQQDYERALQRKGALSTQQIKEEAALAEDKFNVEKQRAAAAGASRSQLAQIEQNKATALKNLYTSGADLVQQGLQGMSPTPSQSQQSQQTQQSQQIQQSQAPTPARVAAAGAIASQGGAKPIQTPKPAPTKLSPVQEMNQRNTMPQPGAGEGYGVLAPVAQGVGKVQQTVQQGQQAVQKVQQTVQQGQQAVQKAQSTFDEAKKKAEELKKNPLGLFGIKS